MRCRRHGRAVHTLPHPSLLFGFRSRLAQSSLKHTTSELPIHSTHMEAVSYSESSSLPPALNDLHSPLSSMLIVLSIDSTWQWMYYTRSSRGSATIGLLLRISVILLKSTGYYSEMNVELCTSYVKACYKQRAVPSAGSEMIP